jgi:hypothetical protein
MSARPDAELESLRYDIAASRGLDAGAAGFLTGTTLEEIEASADALARLIDASGEHRQKSAIAGPDLFTGMVESKARQKRELAALFCGRARQPRDEAGRFAQRAAGFDGGARASLPIAKPPEQAHADLLGHLITASRVYRGGGP